MYKFVFLGKQNTLEICGFILKVQIKVPAQNALPVVNYFMGVSRTNYLYDSQQEK